MKAKDLFKWNALIFGIVTVAHVLRLFFGWELKVSTWMAPMYVSGIAVVIAGWLFWQNYKQLK